MKKTIILGCACLLVTAAVNAQTDTTKKSTTTKSDTLIKKESTQQTAPAKDTKGITAQVNTPATKEAATDKLLRKEEH